MTSGVADDQGQSSPRKHWHYNRAEDIEWQEHIISLHALRTKVLGSPFTHSPLGATPPIGNVDHLSVPSLLFAEWTSAFLTALVISPSVCIIDQAVIRGASAKGQLSVALREGCRQFARHPLKFMLSPGCRLMTLVYAGTYLTANTIEGIYNRQQWPWASTKFVATSLANIGLTLYKDARYTRMYSHGPVKPIPITTYACFTSRDSLTMFASFTLPDKLAFYLRHSMQWHPELCENIVQWSLPCAVQWVTTPLHLWGLHAYNVADAPWTERAAFVRKEFWSNLLTRSVRILPAFGLGGSMNHYLRLRLKQWLAPS